MKATGAKEWPRASVEFAKANAIRPSTLSAALQEIAQDPAVANALFDVLETQWIVDNPGKLVLLAPGAESGLITDLLASGKRPS